MNKIYNKRFSKEPTEKQRLGSLGEGFACNYLEERGYRIIERNYLKKWGEIDIVAKNSDKLHFIEVKSVSREIANDVIYETHDTFRAEDNMHPWKLQRLGRAIQSYLLERDISDDIEWQFDVATVYIDEKRGIHRVQILEDLVM